MKSSEFLGTRLRHLSAILDAAVQEHYDQAGVHFRPRFFPVVKALQAAPAGIVELARRVGVSQPAMTQTVTEMRRAGLVAKVETADRRAHLIELSPFGRNVVDRLSPLWAAVDAAAEELDLEVPKRLSSSVQAALDALQSESFYNRILKHMGSADESG